MYTFVEAVKKLPCNFSSSEQTPILRRINPELKGQIRSLFVVLSDDLFSQILRKFDQKKTTSAPSVQPGTSGSTSESPPPVNPNPASKGSKSRNYGKRGASSDLSSQAKK